MAATSAEAAPIAAPLISVVMANYQAGDKLVPAIESVLRQTVGELELIVCDDASGDHSLALVERFMRTDARVSLIRADANGGPARSRNRGLAAARGQWIAVVDSDDIIHPERFERLLAAAQHFGADIVADDLLHFYEDGSSPSLLLGQLQDRAFCVDAAHWIGSGIGNSPPLGYLKPMIRATTLGAARYDESLRIGEDYDLVLRLLIDGAAMVVVPEPYYLYRRHRGSISHRLSVADLTAMVASQDEMVGRMTDIPASLTGAFAARRSQLSTGLGFERLVAAIKSRNLGAALSLLARDPSLAPRLWQSFVEGRQRRAVAPPRPAATGPIILGQGGRKVPNYVPVTQIDWSAPSARASWLALADIAHGQAVDIVCSDNAARYAAGFVPMARVIEPVPHADMELAR